MKQHRIARGMCALIALAGLVVGVPLALVALAGNPLPPSPDALVQAITAPDLGGAFLMGTLVPLLAWAAWAYLTVGVALEGMAFAKDWRSAVRHRGHRGPGRRFAASLLTAIVVMIGGSAIVGPAHAAEAASPAAGTTAHVGHDLLDGIDGVPSSMSPGESGELTPEPSTGMTAAAAPSGPQTVNVREGDSLWSIADAYLGDGARYPEIVERNAGVPQPDGDALSDDLWLTPGWRILLPPDASPTGDAADARAENSDKARTATDAGSGVAAGPRGDDAIPDQVIVEGGDTLWDLAETYLGDGQRYDDLANASGVANPSAIMPGDVIEVAEAARGGGEPGAPGDGGDVGDVGDVDASGDENTSLPGADDGVDEGTDGVHDGSTVVPAHPIDASAAPPEAPTTTPPTDGGATGAGQPSASTPPVDAAGAAPHPVVGGTAETTTGGGGDQAGAQVNVDETVEGVNLQTVGGIGGVLAAGLLGWLGVRRALQRRVRRPGERIAMPEPELAAFETELRSVDTTTAVLHLDRAMRALAAWAQDESKVMPPVAVVRVDAAEVVFYLDGPTLLPDPFVPVTDDHSAWALAPGQLQPLVREPSPPCPALASLGSDASGAMVFVDLERLGIITVDGEPELVRSALLAIAIELATSTWGDDTRLTLVGFDDALSEQLGSGRIRHVDALADVLPELAGHRRHVAQALHRLDAQSPTVARTSSPDAESWSAEVLVLGHAVGGEALDELAGLALDEPRVGIAAVVGGAVESGWHVELRGPHDATLHLPGDAGSLELDPQLIAEPEFDRLVELARVATGPAHRARTFREETGDWTLSLSPDGAATTRTGDDPGDAARGSFATVDVTDAAARDENADRDIDATPDIVQRNADPATAPAIAEGEVNLDAAADDASPAVDDAIAGVREAGPAKRGAHAKRDRPGLRRRASARGQADDLDEAARDLLASLAHRPWVRLLGPVELLGAAGDPPVTPQTHTINNSTVKRATELVAYLALHPGVTAEQFHAAFWPGKDPRGKTAASNRNGLATRARKWLGTSADGQPYFPHVGSDGYRLDERVTTDWHVLLELIGNDPATAPAPRLRAALDLVRGQPFAGVKERFYGWAEITRMDMLATIADTCHELAVRALDMGDVGAARTTAALGREIDPINEMAWRDALQAELLASDHEGFERIVSLLQQQLDDFEDGYEPEPETQELIDRGRHRARRMPQRDGAFAS
ncbi:hypothetical protein GCM10011490_18070 [Pseudoclavibacter endophyticus]|uniref:LysM peptidoglycan-binding domain-containing protein n=1 Tax=Pseudoclavibacter endophyticus TaxID=1778590 RepID=A0A6H9WJ57_9MICO|nr:LysM peptidoglycan-binding domain-containing protein [Pseudoclavibacter endophyticus]KAB1648846.1 LysM peptidoglycan-binding domain-containing protein [Pseudoclavibacter endophyticus]GGA67858.1 hypothetical protein GCM10011490_18070 [Pseudoclavibacter endophyticus]